MIFRQLIDYKSNTYTYLLADPTTCEGLLIDPVCEHIDQYLDIFSQLGLKLVYAIDTHIHADHITATGLLRQKTGCDIVMSAECKIPCITKKIKDGDKIELAGISLQALSTPGHTAESFSYLLGDRVFTGDCLLIRATGRTDFQSGSPYVQYESIFNKLLQLPDDILVYPAHDYNGMTVSTIYEEKKYNPRLQVNSPEEYADIMDNLNLPKPRLIDIALPANLQCGLTNKELS